ncbi:MAG: FMN-binding protein [Halanaerobiales bacterium]
MKKSILTLTILGLISALLLSFAHQLLTPIIASRQEEGKKDIILAVLPESNNFKVLEKNGIILYEGNKDGEVAIIARGPGFGGEIELIVGANPFERKVYGIKVLSHSETPGLGSHITGEVFEQNFVDKPFGDYQVVKRPVADLMEVEAITGATVSSQLVVDIVKKAINEMLLAYGFDAIAITEVPVVTGATDTSTGATDTSTSATDATSSATVTTGATVTDTGTGATITTGATVTTGATSLGGGEY